MNMDDLSKKKRTRGGHRSYVNKLMAGLEEKIGVFMETGNEQVTRELRQLKITLHERKDTLGQIDEHILDLLCGNKDVSDEEISAETEDAGRFNAKMLDATLAIETALNTTVKPTETVPTTSSTPSTSQVENTESVTQASGITEPVTQEANMAEASEQIQQQVPQIETTATVSVNEQVSRVRLPKLEIKKFDGNLAKWREFWDSYECAIHKNDKLSEIDKFSYLRGLLEGQASTAISGFALTGVNYKEAVDLLKRRYGKDSAIQRTHIKELINIEPVFSENETGRLRKLYDQTETHHRGLKALGVDETSYSSIVVPSLIEKLPKTLRLTLTRGRKHMEWSTTEFLPALLDEVELREAHLEMKDETKERKQRRYPGTAHALLAKYDDGKCPFCLEKHKAEDCQKIKDVGIRKSLIRKYFRCFVCLKNGHRAIECKNCKNACSKCNGNHHVALCEGVKEGNVRDSNVTAVVSSSTSMHVGTEDRVVLQTAQGIVKGSRESGERVRVLFDTGSHRTFVSAKVVDKVRPQVVRQDMMNICTFGNNSQGRSLRDVVVLDVLPISGGDRIKVEAYVVDEITNVKNEHLEVAKLQYGHLKDLWLSDVNKTSRELEVQLLIGADFMWRFQMDSIKRGGVDEPVAVETKLGWVLSGPMKCKEDSVRELDTNVNLIMEDRGDGLDRNFSWLWDLETMGIKEEDEVQVEFLDNISFTGERYEVSLPWKVEHPPLATNYLNSVSRLKLLQKRLIKEPDILKEYDQVIKDQVSKGIVEVVPELEVAGDKVHYLPHQAVVRHNVQTTKVRVVYDASSKAGKGSVCLNNCLHVGPSLNPLLFDVLIRFRLNHVALIGDIEKAFLNVEISRKDRDSLRFLWFEDPSKLDSHMIVYRFCRVVFGLNASPFLLNATLRHHFFKYNAIDEPFVRKMLESFYVDDLVSGESTTDKAYTLYEKAKDRLASGGFKLRKWLSNDKILLKRIEMKEGIDSVEGESDQISYAKSTLGATSKSGEHKVLGLAWDNDRDVIKSSFDVVQRAVEWVATRRNVLRLLAGIFDPLGLISPILVELKILFQELCVAGLGWDDEFHGIYKQKWNSCLGQMGKVGEICINRCVKVSGRELDGHWHLHGFSDASKAAYSAVVYLVYKTSVGTEVSILASKSRVAPLKKLSIPRLELMGAWLLARLVDSV